MPKLSSQHIYDGAKRSCKKDHKIAVGNIGADMELEKE